MSQMLQEFQFSICPLRQNRRTEGFHDLFDCYRAVGQLVASGAEKRLKSISIIHGKLYRVNKSSGPSSTLFLRSPFLTFLIYFGFQIPPCFSWMKTRREGKGEGRTKSEGQPYHTRPNAPIPTGCKLEYL